MMIENEQKPAALEGSDDIDLKKAFLILWRGKWWLAVTITVSLILGLLSIKNSPEIYAARAIFGFKEDSRNIYPQEIASITRIFGGSSRSVDTTLTQITGNAFLKKVVVDLNLLKDREFYTPPTAPAKYSLENLKSIIKNQLGIETKIRTLSNQQKTEQVINKLRGGHLDISLYYTGGYEIKVTSNDPEKAANIANKIANSFLELRLSNKIDKSEKALAYLSEKLAEAKAEMERANRQAELFALERNILTDQEFLIKANRLKEFRVKITQINSTLEQLEYFNKLLLSETATETQLKGLIDNIIDLSPRTKPARPFFDKNGARDFRRELNHFKNQLPGEISRLRKSQEITIDGISKLEQETKQASSETRKFRNLEMNAQFRTTTFQALVKEFETQSIVDGYKEAMGEIYEIAQPPLVRSGSKMVRTLALSTVIGFFVGLVISFIMTSVSKTIFYKLDFEKALGINNTLVVSKTLSNVKKVLPMLLGNNFSKNLKRDILVLNSVGLFIAEQKTNPGPLKITCATIGLSSAAHSVAFLLADYLTKDGRNVLLLDFSRKSDQLIKTFSKKALKPDVSLAESFIIRDNMAYLKKNFSDKAEQGQERKLEKKSTETDLAKNYEIIIKIVDKLENEPKSLQETLKSDFFLIIGVVDKIKINDLIRVKNSIGIQVRRCLAGVFVSN